LPALKDGPLTGGAPGVQVCEGLGPGGAVLAAAAFDARQPVHVYGATLDGRLLQLTLGNPRTLMHCRVCPPPWACLQATCHTAPKRGCQYSGAAADLLAMTRMSGHYIVCYAMAG